MRFIRKSFVRNVLPLIVSAAALFLPAFQAAAIISTNLNLQMQLGNPSGASNDPNNHFHYLIQRTVETIDYSDTNGCPNWASWDLTTTDTCCVARTDAYAQDTSLPSGFRKITNGTFTGYDRGHMCPSADRLDTTPDNTLVFLMSNMIVQDSKNNQGVWDAFEGYCRTQLTSQELLIICGPYDFSTVTAGASKVYIASNIFKIVVCAPLGADTALGRITNANPSSIRVIAIETPNDDSVSGKAWTTFVTSVKQVQQDTGYNFFSALPNNLGWVLRSKVDGQTPAAPGITSFAPPSGTVGASVTITGARLDTVTNVFFNGTVASYTITATNQITATVPAGATSGTITAKGLGGNGTSSSSFTVTTAGNPDLAITKSHTGTFTQGDTADTYTITVSNVGTADSSGSVIVSDAAPAGLTITAMSGSGWTADLGSSTCTRSDALAAGAGYPPITVTVSVATNAAASLTNTAAVSGGGDVNAANNTANDPTAIIALTPIQSWRLQYFGTTNNTAAAADTANPMGDGVANLLKYALGMDPLVPATSPVVVDISTGFLRLTVPRNPSATDVTFSVEVTDDLTASSWTTAGTTVDVNTATLLQVHDNTPVSSATSRFIRLHVSRP
ncbi:MAG: DNA/RNA non-specific endonuclease [Verrucomicrobiia bacterium]